MPSLKALAARMEAQAKIKCGHGRSKMWCTECRKGHIETAAKDPFVTHHSFKGVFRTIRRTDRVSVGKPKGCLG